MAHSRVTYALDTPRRGSTGWRVVDPGPVSAISRPLGSGDAEALATLAPARTSQRAVARPAAASGEDAALVAGVLSGDRSAEEALYRRHAASVLRLATRLLRSHEDAMDVLQDAFVSAFEELGSLREHDAFQGWVHRIAVRLVHRRFRRRRLLGLLGLDRSRHDAVSLESLADGSASQEARVELRWLDAALARIDDRERIAWMLRHVEGLALEEVAEACECSLATVKRRITSAEAVVRRHLDGGAE